MAHQHHHTKGLTVAFWLNLLFSLVELTGGLWTNSIAVMADAFHDFMDAVAIGTAVLLEKLSGKKRTPGFSYGYRRFSLLAALGLSLFLIAGTVVMSIGAIRSFIHPKELNSIGMLWLAVLGVLVNGIAFLRIKKEGNQSHGHNHNSRAIMLHLLEDMLGWIAVLIGATIIYFTQWYWIDGVLTLAIAGYVAYNAVKNLIGTMKVLLQAVPENVNIRALSAEIEQIDGVAGMHDFHVWSLDGTYNVGTLHVVIRNTEHQDENVIRDAVLELMRKHNIQHPTVQIETSVNNCSLKTC